MRPCALREGYRSGLYCRGPRFIERALDEKSNLVADAGFQWTIQSFDRSRSATPRAISAGASSGIGNTELTLISPST